MNLASCLGLKSTTLAPLAGQSSPLMTLIMKTEEGRCRQTLYKTFYHDKDRAPRELALHQAVVPQVQHLTVVIMLENISNKLMEKKRKGNHS